MPRKQFNDPHRVTTYDDFALMARHNIGKGTYYDKRHLDTHYNIDAVEHHSVAQLNPTDSVADHDLIGKQKNKSAKDNNMILMNKSKVHIGKVLISLGVDKYLYDTDPSVMTALTDAGIFAVSDIFVKDRLEGVFGNAFAGLSAEMKDATYNLFSGLAINSAIQQRLPTVRDVMVFGIPEGVSLAVNTDALMSAAQSVEKQIYKNVQY